MIKTAYNSEASYSYDDKRFVTPQGQAFDQLEKEQLLRVLHYTGSPSRILEVGCGTGRFLRSVLTENEYTSWGIDPSPAMLRVTKSKLAEYEHLRLARSEGAVLPFLDDSFDLVYSIRVLNQVASRGYALDMVEEIVRVSRRWVLIEFVNESRLVHRSRKGVQLTLEDIRKALVPLPVRIVNVSGVLFFSQTVLGLIPPFCLDAFLPVDRKLSGWFPRLCGRMYVTLKKTPDTDGSRRSAV